MMKFSCDFHSQNLASEKLSCDKVDCQFGGVNETGSQNHQQGTECLTLELAS